MSTPFTGSPGDMPRRWWTTSSPVWRREGEIALGEAGGRRIGHRDIAMIVLLAVLATTMTLAVIIMLELRIERVPAATNAFMGYRAEIQGLDTAVRSMQASRRALASTGQDRFAMDFEDAARAAHARFDRLKGASCAQGGNLLAPRARMDDLASQLDAYQRLLWPARTGAAPLQAAPMIDLSLVGETGAVADRINDHLLEIDRGAHDCFRALMNDHAAAVTLAKMRASVLLALIGGTVIAILVLRRSDQSQLRDQLRFNEQLIDAIPLPLSLRSADGNFMLVNRAFEQRTGFSRKYLLGKPVRATMPHADAEAIDEMDTRAKAAIDPVEESFAVTRDGGPTRHVQVRVHALRQPDDSIFGIVGIQTDVTPLRQKEAQLTEMNARLTQLSVQMINAQEDERRRIARDLHDQVGQILTALKLQLASLSKRQQIDSPSGALTTPIDLTEEALRHTRDLSASLHPHLLDDLGIEPALNWLIDRFIRPSIANVELRCRLEPARGREEIELVVFRVVQEALTNVIRHAHATRVGVILEAGAGELTIEVIDDGVGFDAGNTWFDLQRSTSLGVTSMQDRVTEVGGDLQVQSSPGGGTSLRVRLPW
ncbi:MAG TPA: PAS domain S-box protein [Ramlibacter sp.]|nr:PAS domain S-box protein [Ramlibacter sp.]